MNLEQLRTRLQFLNDPAETTNLSMYVILRNGDVRFANLAEDVRSELKQKFLDFLSRKLYSISDVNYCNLTDYNDKINTICYYDLPEPLPSLSSMNVVSEQEQQVEFSFKDDDFGSIDSYVFLIGNEANKVALYKNHSTLSLIRRDGSFISLVKANNELVKVQSDILKISETFEFLKIDNHVIVFSIKSLENSHGYTGILMRTARTKLEIIRTANIIENVEELEELIAHKKYAKKIIKVKSDTPVLLVRFDRLKSFILNHPQLKRRIKFNALESQIKFHSKNSKELFIKILSDSYLKSELTDLLYESDDKEQLSSDEID